MANDFAQDKRPIDWTSYEGRPSPDPVYGWGVIDGYARTSVYDTAKPQYPVDKFAADTAVAVLEHEDGDIGNGIVHKTDARYFPAEAPGELARLRIVAKAVRSGLAARFGKSAPPLLWYRPVMNRPGQSGFAYRDALKVQRDSGIFDAFDAVVLDAHPHFNEAFSVWAGLLDEQIEAVRAVCKKPLVAVINEQWHPADGPMAWKFISDGDIAPRYRYAREHPGLWRVARMGGYDAVGGFRRLTYGSNPAERAINQALGIRSAA